MWRRRRRWRDMVSMNRHSSNFSSKNRDLWDEYNGIIEEWENKNPRPDDSYFKGLQAEGWMRYHHPLAYDWQARRNGFALENRLEASDRRFKIFRANQMLLAKEALLVDKCCVADGHVSGAVASNGAHDTG